MKQSSNDWCFGVDIAVREFSWPILVLLTLDQETWPSWPRRCIDHSRCFGAKGVAFCHRFHVLSLLEPFLWYPHMLSINHGRQRLIERIDRGPHASGAILDYLVVCALFHKRFEKLRQHYKYDHWEIPSTFLQSIRGNLTSLCRPASRVSAWGHDIYS
jgi:hypothetical protein